MKGPVWNEDAIFVAQRRREQKTKQDEWREHFLTEFGRPAYELLKGFTSLTEIVIDAEVVEDDAEADEAFERAIEKDD